MLVTQSTAAPRNRKGSKPDKPRPDFPLFPHASGKWAKVIRGKTYYFGRWDDPHAAESAYLKVADDLHAGRVPRPDSDGGLMVRDLCNKFLQAKRLRMEADSLSPRTFLQYHSVCEELVKNLGSTRAVADLTPQDFTDLYATFVKKLKVNALSGRITVIRSIFKFADDNDLIDKRVKFGSTFKVPSRSEIRKAKSKRTEANGKRLFTPAELHAMLDAATPPLRAMILLGINCGFGNTDCACLPQIALDLKAGWINFPRPKTGVERRIPLWPETIDALQKVLAARPRHFAAEDADLVFITRWGQRWVRFALEEKRKYGKLEVKPQQDDAIAKATGKLLRELHLKRPGLSFYTLRHTFETIAGQSKDQVAVDSIMGHVDPSMAATYRQEIGDDRLRAVVNHVHDWLFAESAEQSS